MTIYDLHTHTIASDGVLTSEELITRAHHRGVNVLAITDHDTTAGLESGQQYAKTHDITLICGIEISVTWGKNHLHIVGLNIDAGNDELQSELLKVQQTRQARAKEIARRLEQAGIKDALTGAQQFSANNNLTRTHFARYLMKIGKARTMSDVFKRYLSYGNPGYVSAEWMALDKTIQIISSAGGQAVVAHPSRYKMTNSKMRKFLAEFSSLGGKGMEVVNSGSTRELIKHNAKLANEFELYGSIGSDFHSPDNKYIDLGRFSPLPDDVRPIWAEW